MNKILSPKNDYVFKLLFTRDTEILTDLINCVLELPAEKRIRSSTVKNPGILPDEILKKFIVLDIRALDDSGREYEIEIQVRRFASYPERALYYLCRLLSDQLKSGQEYRELNPVIGIHFLDYEQFPENADFAYTFDLRDIRHPELRLTDLLTLHIFELPGIEKIIAEKNFSPSREWFRFFNHAHEEKEETMKQHYTNPRIHRAFDVLKTLSANEKIRREADIRERSLANEVILMSGERKAGIEEGIIRGKKEGIIQGKKEGIVQGKKEGIVQGKKEGIVQGKKEGRNQGRKEQAAETALKMIAKGMETDVIAELTGLNNQEIEKLKTQSV